MSATSAFIGGRCLRSTPFTPARPSASRSALRVEANRKVQKKSKVIMVKDLVNVGNTGEIKAVPVGFWRNYLLPNGFAKLATEGILSQIRKQKEDVIRSKLEQKAQAKAFATALQTIGKFMIKKKTGDKDQIYGSVLTSEIADAIYQQTGKKLDEKEFEVPEIKSVGTYECRVKLHPDVAATFSIVIQKEKQAPGGEKKAAAKK